MNVLLHYLVKYMEPFLTVPSAHFCLHYPTYTAFAAS